MSSNLITLSNKYVLYESTKFEKSTVWWHQNLWKKTTKSKTYYKSSWKFNKIRFSTAKNSVSFNFHEMTICKIIDQKVHFNEIKKVVFKMYSLLVYICSFIIEKTKIKRYETLFEKFWLHQWSIDKASFDWKRNRFF